MNGGKKMLFLFGVNWKWIKQRPHFLAIQLKRHLNLRAYYPNALRDFFITNDAPKDFHSIFQLPFGRFSFVRKINDVILKISLFRQLRMHDVLWISDPWQYHVISKHIHTDMIVVYDCMDDMVEFAKRRGEEKLVYGMEAALLTRANHILVSSQKLQSVLEKRYELNKKPVIINNAIDESFIFRTSPVIETEYPSKSGFLDVVYIGTVANWMDFSLLEAALHQFPQLRFVLVGPVDTPLPAHDRIIALGTKKHDQLPFIMAHADALMMPFVIHPLILSVNPVKLYEYIVSEKPIITCYYPEIDTFGGLVYSYSHADQFMHLIERLFAGNLPAAASADRLAFLKENTWGARVDTILKMFKIQDES